MNYVDNFKDKKVLITGGTGFIGSTLAHHLVRYGAIVTIVDSMIPDYGGSLQNLDGIRDKIRINNIIKPLPLVVVP